MISLHKPSHSLRHTMTTRPYRTVDLCFDEMATPAGMGWRDLASLSGRIATHAPIAWRPKGAAVIQPDHNRLRLIPNVPYALGDGGRIFRFAVGSAGELAAARFCLFPTGSRKAAWTPMPFPTPVPTGFPFIEKKARPGNLSRRVGVLLVGNTHGIVLKGDFLWRGPISRPKH